MVPPELVCANVIVIIIYKRIAQLQKQEKKNIN
jgi:hypothetical protein